MTTAQISFSDLTKYKALLFDLDGVLTPTAALHQQAWAAMFTQYLAEHDLKPYESQDYFDYLDGRRRDEGIPALLKSRGVELPYNRAEVGQEGEDSAEDDTVIGLGLRKNEEFLHLLDQGIDPYPGSLRLLDAVTEYNKTAQRPIAMAVVSSSKNTPRVLEAADLTGYFSEVVDGRLAEEKGLAGKPSGDTYVYAAKLYGLEPGEAVVFEDATSGVAAGRDGKFGLVVGVDRGAGKDALLANGADVVIEDLEEYVL